MIPTRLLHVESAGPRLKTFWFEKPDNFLFSPGEYIEMFLEHANADNRGEHRKFTISSAPSAMHLGFTISFSKYGSSFKQALDNLAIGDSIRISEPIGDFVLPKLQSIPVIGLAVGSGITPFMSMASAGQTSNMQIVHIVRGSEDIITLHANSFTPHVLDGPLQVDDILKQVVVQTETLFYLAGPEVIVDTLRSHLLLNNITTDRIVTDRFIGAANL